MRPPPVKRIIIEPNKDGKIILMMKRKIHPVEEHRKFKPGDKVVCVNNTGWAQAVSHLVIDKTYTVLFYTNDTCIQVTDDIKNPDSTILDFSYDVSRFESVIDQRKRKLIKLNEKI